jgi:cell division transport system permease protein
MTDQLKYSVSKGFSIFKNNLKQNFTSLITLGTLIFFYLAVFSVNYSAAKAVDNLTDVKTIRVFIVEGGNKNYIEKKLFDLQIPADIEFFSKEKSKKRVTDIVPEAQNINKLPYDLFPEFFEIKVSEYAAVEGLLMEAIEKIEQIKGVNSVEYGKRVTKKMQKVKNTSYIFVVLLTILTGLSTAFVIFNTIRLTLYKYKKHIMIYNLVGATSGFITLPYVFSSILEITMAYTIAVVANWMFVEGVTTYLLQNSYFALFTPGLLIYAIFYACLTAVSLMSAYFCVTTFNMRLKSINEG